MRKKKSTSLTTLFAILMLSAFGFVGITGGNPAEAPYNTLVNDTIWGPATVDPAWVYDTSSATLIMNVYDTLINFKVNRTIEDVTKQGLTDQFEMNLATEMTETASPHPEAPTYTNNTWYFKIRTGVKYHDSTYGTVTPADVEYSFERWMVFSRSGGPQWMIYEPLLGPGSSVDWSDSDMPTKIDKAVESNSTHVWFNLKVSYPPMVFKQIIAQSWAGVMPNEWAYEHNCWPGEAHSAENPYTNATMTMYYDPEKSPLDDYPSGTGGRVECGSGPYKLTNFDATAHRYTLGRFADYWRGWPAPGCDDYLDTIIFKGIDSWSTRKVEFLAGDCDFCYVPRENLPEVIVNWPDTPEEYPSGITCYKDLPGVSNSAYFYTFNITTAGNLYIGDAPYTTIHETGLPHWFFNDTHTGQSGTGKDLRHAFAYSFDWDTYISAAFLGEAKQPPNPEVEGLAYDEYLWDVDEPDLSPADTVSTTPPYHQPLLPNDGAALPPNRYHYYNLTKAEEYFKAAWNGDVWDTGFTFTILYNTGNTARKIAAEMMKDAVEGINTKFTINVQAVDWPTYLTAMVSGDLPMFIIGWLADYPDPHNWFHPFMHSEGAFSEWQGYHKDHVDELIEQGISETNDTKRVEIYHELGEIYFEDAPGLILSQATGRHWEQTTVQGWYYNPIYPGPYYYHLWKAPRGYVTHRLTVSTFPMEGGTTNPGGSISYAEGSVINVNVTVDEDYEFNYWELDGAEWTAADKNTTVTVTMDRDHILRAYVAPIIPVKLVLAVVPADGGNTTPGAGAINYAIDETVSVTITVATGYEFNYWELDGKKVSEETSYTVTMDTAHTLRAYVKEIPPMLSTEGIIAIIAIIIAIAAIGVALFLRRK